MEKARIEFQGEQSWETITYHPKPFVTWFKYPHSKDYYKEKGCTIEILPLPEGFMSNLVRGVKVRISWPDDHTQSYVEPLASFHNQFWGATSEVHHNTYPYDNNRKTKAYRQHFMGYDINSFIADYYWELDYKNYTPEEWANHLNKILETLETKVDSIHEFLILFIISFMENNEEEVVKALDSFLQKEKRINVYDFKRCVLEWGHGFKKSTIPLLVNNLLEKVNAYK